MAIEDPSPRLPITRPSATAVTDRNAFAARLQPLFESLGTSYRTYGSQHHISASALCRYLNGERVPAPDFLSGLFADLEGSGKPVSLQEQTELLRLREKALRGGSSLQQLQAQLDETLAELSDSQEEQAGLVRQVARQEAALERANAQLDALRTQIAQHLAVHLAEFVRIEHERDDLRRQVESLRAELLSERTWALRTEERRLRLAWHLKMTIDRAGPTGSPDRLLADVVRAPVQQLLRTVTGAGPAHRALATEIVRAVGHDRPVPDVAALFTALHRAGHPEQVRTAMADAVRDRPAHEVADLVRSFTDHGLDGLSRLALDASVRLRNRQDLARLTWLLNPDGRSTRLAEQVVVRAARLWPVDELVRLLLDLHEVRLQRPTVASAVERLALSWRVPDLLRMTVLLAEADRLPLGRRLVDGVIRSRRPSDTAAFLAGLSRSTAGPLADRALAERAGAGPGLTLAGVLDAVGENGQLTGSGRDLVARLRAADMARLVGALDETGFASHAAALTAEYLGRRPERAARCFARDLDRGRLLLRLLLRAASTRPAPEYGRLLRRLDGLGLSRTAGRLLTRAAGDLPTTAAVELLLAVADVPQAVPAAVAGAAGRSVHSVARLVNELRAATHHAVAAELQRAAERRALSPRAELLRAIADEAHRVAAADGPVSGSEGEALRLLTVRPVHEPEAVRHQPGTATGARSRPVRRRRA